MRTSKAGLLTLFALFVIFPTLEANSQDLDDELWQKRADEAKKASRKAYNPNPHEVTEKLNMDVHKALDEAKATRRALEGPKGMKKKPKKNGGKCLATNPIDRCWRCDPDWAKNRKKLADCALGFGRGTTGGQAGDFYVVTSNADDDLVNPKPGTLRHAVIQDRPLWITFAHDMVIRLSQELIMTDDKTIDGRGAHVLIKDGAQITIQYVKNIIIHNIHIRGSKAGNGGMIRDSVHHYGYRGTSDGDGISIFGSSRIWIDHVSISDCKDGLIDAVMGSTAITISNCHFTHHNDVMLFGASDKYSEDAVMQITVAFNHFGQGLIQRMPRCRWGFVHVVNNDYTHWLMYAIGGSKHPTILSQGNRFIAPPNVASKEVTKREYSPESEWKSWSWRSEKDLMMNGAFFVQSGPPIKNLDKKDVITAKPGTYVSRLTRFAGPLGCRVNKPC